MNVRKLRGCLFSQMVWPGNTILSVNSHCKEILDLFRLSMAEDMEGSSKVTRLWVLISLFFSQNKINLIALSFFTLRLVCTLYTYLCSPTDKVGETEYASCVYGCGSCLCGCKPCVYGCESCVYGCSDFSFFTERLGELGMSVVYIAVLLSYFVFKRGTSGETEYKSYVYGCYVISFIFIVLQRELVRLSTPVLVLCVWLFCYLICFTERVGETEYESCMYGCVGVSLYGVWSQGWPSRTSQCQHYSLRLIARSRATRPK